MSRDTITPDVDAEFDNDNYRVLILTELDFPSGTVYAHSGVGNVNFNGHTFLGVGQLGKIGTLQESTELQTFGFSLELSGVDLSLLSITLNDDVQGRSAKLWMVFLDNDLQPINDPIGPWSGRMDAMPVEIGETATITLHIESRLADWERPRIRRYTDADQQAEYPGDLGFEFVSQMQEKEIMWGPS